MYRNEIKKGNTITPITEIASDGGESKGDAIARALTLRELRFDAEKLWRTRRRIKIYSLIFLLEDIPMTVFNCFLVFYHNAREQEIIFSLIVSCMVLGKKFGDVLNVRVKSRQAKLIANWTEETSGNASSS